MVRAQNLARCWKPHNVRAQNLARLLEAAQRDRTGGPRVIQGLDGRRIVCSGNEEEHFYTGLMESLETGELKPTDFSLRDLFEATVPDGREIIASWNPKYGGAGSINMTELTEAEVNTAAFRNITGQIVFSEMLSAFQNPSFIGDQLCRTIPTQFNGEKIPGISNLGDVAQPILEGRNYPQAGVNEEWVETPETTKRGFIVPVTKEAIFFDRTGFLLDRARAVGEALGINKEKRIIDMATGITDLYKRNGATSATPTYGDSSGAHNWDNLAATNALVDWTDIENAMLLFDGLSDPNTGEPIIVNPNALIVPTALKWTAAHILNATEVTAGIPGSTNFTTLRRGGNPLAGTSLTVLSNAWVSLRTSSASTWFIGDFKKAFAYMENWPITSVEAPPNSHDEFQRDVVQQFKVSERGTVAVLEPRAAVKSTA